MQQDPVLKDRARSMRRTMTPAEQRLWFALRAHRFEGVKFARQVVIGSYIVDLAARAAKLVIELDGDSHGSQEAYDARRTAYLEQQGYHVIRFANANVMGNLEGVLQTIRAALGSAPLPTLSPEGRGLPEPSST